MRHWWSGGAFDGYPATRVRYYVDGDPEFTVDLPLGLAHGMSPSSMDDNAPWSAGALFGRTGSGMHTARAGSHGSGLFNTYHIPFFAHINVTIMLGCARGLPRQAFWFTLRGQTRATLTLPGSSLNLPPTARLRTFENHNLALPGYGTHTVLNMSGGNHSSASRSLTSGAVLLVTLAVSSPMWSYGFLEGCLRAGSERVVAVGRDKHERTGMAIAQHSRSRRRRNVADEPATMSQQTGGGDGDTHGPAADDSWLLSSGTEDYFLGSFYFNRGQYFMPLAGVTSLCPPPGGGAASHGRPPIGCIAASRSNGTVSFSAYRLHAGYDPLTFSDGPSSARSGFNIWWRNGEPGHGGGRPLPVNVSSLAMVYVWNS